LRIDRVALAIIPKQSLWRLSAWKAWAESRLISLRVGSQPARRLLI